MDSRTCGCTVLSSLSRSQLVDFLIMVNNEDILFRSSLDLDSHITYGSEIEVNDIDLDGMKRIVADFNLKHNLDEGFCYEAHDEMTAGSEVVTPILSNRSDMWNTYYDMFSILNKSGAKVGSNTASHVHIGTHLINTPQLLSLFLKTLAVFEPIIFKFGYGVLDEPRDLIKCISVNSNYAMMMSPIRVNGFIKELDKCGAKKKKVEESVVSSFLAPELEFRPAFNFNKFNFEKLNGDIVSDDPSENDNMEIRCFNGTLSPEIAQNNINLMAHIMEAVVYGSIDKDYIEKEYSIYRKKKYNFDVWRAVIIDEKESVRYNRLLNGFSSVKMDKALKLADMIFRNDLDKVYFLKQYLKLFEREAEEVKGLVR